MQKSESFISKTETSIWKSQTFIPKQKSFTWEAESFIQTVEGIFEKPKALIWNLKAV